MTDKQIAQLLQIIANSKLFSQLLEQTVISDDSFFASINTGEEDAKKIKLPLLRGYSGDWNANTNTPSLANGVGLSATVYRVSVAGTRDLGNGAVTYGLEEIIYYNGAKWVKLIQSQISDIQGLQAALNAAISASNVSLVDTNLIVAKDTNLQSFAESIDHAVLKQRGTGVASTYVSTVVVGGTTFSQPAVFGEIHSDQGYFDTHYTGGTAITVSNLNEASTYIYIDNAGVLQQQTTKPTGQDWVRKMFTMRIAVDVVSQTILGFEYLNNPIGRYSNSIRDMYSYLLAQGVPFKKDQIVTGRTTDLGFNVSEGSFFEFGGTGNIFEPNTPILNAVANANFTLATRTAVDSGTNTNLPKFWDNNGVLTPLGLPSSRLDIGTAVNFGVLAGGAISGTGSSTGDIGSDTGSIASAITSTGTIYSTGDAVVVAALADFSTAYNEAKNKSYDTLLSSAAFELGGSTLTAGVYKIGAAATLATPMSFNAQGDSDATFIIQIVGALGTTASVGNVILLNGAKSSNIFWVIEGASTLGSNTNMEGTLLCGGAISFGGTTTINGRAFAGSSSGTVALSTTTITLPTELTVPSVVGHRLYRFSNGNLVMQYGQGNYANINLARSGVLNEDYVLNPQLKNATFFGWWLIESTATNTSGTTKTGFIEYVIGIQGGSSSSLSGAVLKANNGSDFNNIPQTRINLGINTTANQTDSSDKRFMSDAQETLLDNTPTLDAQNVKLTGNQTIAGEKTFTDANTYVQGNLTITSGSQDSNVSVGGTLTIDNGSNSNNIMSLGSNFTSAYMFFKTRIAQADGVSVRVGVNISEAFEIGADLKVLGGGDFTSNLTVTGTGQFGSTVSATDYRVLALNTAPTSATDTGFLGEIRYTADYIYVCTATNTWKRTAITTW